MKSNEYINKDFIEVLASDIYKEKKIIVINKVINWVLDIYLDDEKSYDELNREGKLYWIYLNKYLLNKNIHTKEYNTIKNIRVNCINCKSENYIVDTVPIYDYKFLCKDCYKKYNGFNIDNYFFDDNLVKRNIKNLLTKYSILYDNLLKSKNVIKLLE